MDNTNIPKSRVLVVDDEPDVLLFTRGMLEEHRYRVLPASSGALALKAFIPEPPDVVLMDVDMPEMSGYETCRQMKMHEGIRDVPVIFLSGKSESVDKVRAFQSGGVDFVTKPFKFDELSARIDHHVSRSCLPKESEDRFHELKKLEMLRDKLTQMIVHDMRGPLAVIASSIDLTLENHRSDLGEEGFRLLTQGRSQADVMGRMMADMLEVSLLEEGEMPVNLTKCDLVEILDEALSTIVLSGRNLIVNAPVSPCLIYCDRYLMQRAISNLIRNAVMSTGDGGDVGVTARRGVKDIRVEVTNPGPGIASENHEKTFEKFGGIATPVIGQAPLTGLGLTFCQLVVNAHGGSLRLKCSPAEGTTFWFTIPPDGRPVIPKLRSY